MIAIHRCNPSIAYKQRDTTFSIQKNENRETNDCNVSTRFDPLLQIVYYPPYPSLSRSSCLYPERKWTNSLVQLENIQIRLQTLNAYIATLGGGYFLCHYLSTAVQLARSQRRVALALGDWSLALKCTLNEAYNFIYAGHVTLALGLIRQVKAKAKTLVNGDKDLILGMCKSAKWVAKKVRLVGNEIKVQSGNKLSFENEHNFQPFDDFHRVRVVRDRPRLQ